jgi:DNA-binding winged helix-turn-helix (wHTH) protein/Tol biopolymer transport system component
MWGQAKEIYAFGPFRLDSRERVLRRGDQPVPLAPKAVDILLLLVQNAEHLLDKDELIRQVWPDAFVEEGNLTKNIFILRKALGTRDDGGEYIETVARRGYRFAVPVSRTAEEPGIADVTSEARPGRTPDANGVRPLRVESIDRWRGHAAAAAQAQPAEDIDPDPKPAAAPVPHAEHAEQPQPEPRSGTPQAARRWPKTAAVIALVTAVALLALWVLLPSPTPVAVRTTQLTHLGLVRGDVSLASDGTQIYFTQREGGRLSLARVGVAGGEPVPILTPFVGAIMYDMSISRAELLVGSRTGGEEEGPLWVMPLAGGAPRRLGDLIAQDAVWSPDGQRIAYASGSTLYAIQADGTGVRKLCDSPGWIHYPRWSPDGRVLRFSSSDKLLHTESMWEISSDGTNLHPILPGWREPPLGWGDGEAGGAWTPDGKYFIFRSSRAHTTSIWAIREYPDWWRRLSRAPVLLTTSDLYFWHTLPSTRAGKVFFAGGNQLREFVAYDARLKHFVPYLSGAPIRRIGFSKDGQWAAYITEPGLILWRSKLDGSERLQLGFAPMGSWDPRWSPDGKQIAFYGGPPGPQKIFLISREGGSPTAVTAGDFSDTSPQWSADGNSLLFRREPIAKDGAVGTSHLYTIDLRTKVLTALPGSENLANPAWSPDGRYAAALTNDGHKLLLFDFQSQRWSELAAGVGFDAGPFWTRDSAFVYVQDMWAGASQPILKVRLKDRHVEQVATAKALVRNDTLGYALTGLTPDDQPVASLLVRDTDIYALDVSFP